ncbi:InlB B-repeat-containing protein, partial [Lysinibacillus sp. NPDC093197]|uniref:InlB B-repeat-containing protein n=1 Tax=Lysinibacillus sp. NPDC093197 TaxID=3364132 RepID=UPI0037F6F691
AVASQTVAHGEKATVPPAPTKAGYTFEGWYTDDEGTNQYDFTNNVITANTTLYAKWEPLKYTVSFEVSGGSAVASQTVAHGEKATVPPAPTKAGYTFEGWYTDDEGTEQYDFSNNVITANTTLYAKWEPVGYTVNFEVNGGSAVPSQSVAHGQKASEPTPTPTKAGYTFGGWYTDVTLTETYDFNNEITANTTLYAKWKLVTYTVNFEVNGGSLVPNQTVAHGEKATVPTVPTKAGYTFEGWYTDDEGTEQYDFSNNVITANTTLYAKWEPVGYTVNFEVNGGSAVPSQSVAHGQKASEPTPTPTKAGYTFGGWYTDVTLTKTYDFNNEITANTTLYGKWKPVTYTVSFEVNGGSQVPSQSVAHGQKASEPTPTKAGYIFGGWYTSSTLEKLFDFNSSSITRSVTIYSKWIKVVSPPTNNDSNESSTPSTNTEHIVVNVEGEGGVNLTKTPIIRTTMPDGVIKDQVSMSEDIAKETIEKAKQLGNDTARIIIPDANDKVSEVVIDIPKSSVAQINAGNINLEIATMNAIISIPNVSMSNFDNDLYFRLVPIKTSEQQHQVEDRILKEDLIKDTLQSEKVYLIGRPMTIETNMQNRPVTLTLPLPKNITQEQLNNLAIYIEHSDGTKELLRGKVVDYQKDMLGVQFEVTKFSTFSILYLPVDEEPTTDDITHTPYIQGYADGTFRPNASVTRAQMASMFARQLTGNAIPQAQASYTDTMKHDAKDAIEFVKDAGLFNGVTETSFNPNGFITRAQMAAVAARWIEKHCVDNPNADFCKTTSEGNAFKDVSNNHWAVQAIDTVYALGIMTGTTADTFNPDGNLTRAQAVKVLNHLFERQAPTELQSPIFKDVQSNHWAFYEIQEAAVKHTHNR